MFKNISISENIALVVPSRTIIPNNIQKQLLSTFDIPILLSTLSAWISVDYVHVLLTLISRLFSYLCFQVDSLLSQILPV